LGIRDQHTFPPIFVRENCADAALTEDDVDEDYIASAGAVVVYGTHFSKPNLDAMSKKAMRLAKKHGGRVIFDVDYRRLNPSQGFAFQRVYTADGALDETMCVHDGDGTLSDPVIRSARVLGHVGRGGAALSGMP
jgi:sugar/nucleoside kinase (ribokinase family)